MAGSADWFCGACLSDDGLTGVAVNDMADLKTNAHLFRYELTYGAFPGKVETREGVIKIAGQNIVVLSQKDPSSWTSQY